MGGQDRSNQSSRSMLTLYPFPMYRADVEVGRVTWCLNRRALVAALRAQAAQQGIGVVFVPADNDDTHALDFYHALGGTAAPVTIFTFTQERNDQPAATTT